jgi:hypothetical protein
MIYTPGATSKSIDVQIVDDSGLAVTGLLAATFPATYWSAAGNTASTLISLSDLSLITSAYSSGGVKERAGSAGIYRLDVPDAALAGAADVKLYGEASGKHLICEAITVATLDANVTKISGTSQTARDLGASVLISSGIGTGQLDVTSGVIKSNLSQILGTALTETAGQIAAGFKKFFNIGTPAATMDHGVLVDTVTTYTGNTVQTGDAYARLGAAGAGLTALGDTRIANLDATVSSRSTYSGADTAGTTTLLGRLTAARAGYLDVLNGIVAAIWAAVTDSSGITTLLGRLTGTRATNLDNLDAAISTRLATSGYTAPPSAATIAAQVTTDHGSGSYIRNTEPDNTAIAEIATDTDTIISNTSGLSGSGAYLVTVTVTDGATALQNATVRLSEGINTFTAKTDGSGVASFNVNTATYALGITKGGYQFTPGSIVVTMAANFDKVMTQIAIPASPIDAALCRVYAYIETLDNNQNTKATIEFTLMSPDPVKSDRLIAGRTVTVGTDTGGRLVNANGDPWIDLQRNDNLTPSGTVYKVTSHELNLVAEEITLAASTFDLASVVP